MFRVRVMELRGPLAGFIPDHDRHYHADVIFAGVKLETAHTWLKHCGWRMYLAWVPEQQFDAGGKLGTITVPRHQVNECAPMRLRLKGRCWIEDPARPATWVRGQYDPVDLPARVRAAAEQALDAARERLRPTLTRRRRRMSHHA